MSQPVDWPIPLPQPLHRPGAVRITADLAQDTGVAADEQSARDSELHAFMRFAEVELRYGSAVIDVQQG